MTNFDSTQIERIKPQVINGIEFYVSADGSTAGCSRPGIAALCGIAATSMAAFIDDNSRGRPPGKHVPKSLQALLQQPYYPQLVGIRSAPILKEEVCIAIIEYYAFHSPNKNDVAAHSYRKFAAMGWHKWVLEITGHKPYGSSELSPALAGAIYEELKLLRQDVKQLINIERIAQESHPQLSTLVNEYGKGVFDIPPGLPEPFTYGQWAHITKLDKAKLSDLALRRRVAELVKALRGAKYLKHGATGNVLYYYSDLPAFIACLQETSALAKPESR